MPMFKRYVDQTDDKGNTKRVLVDYELPTDQFIMREGRWLFDRYVAASIDNPVRVTLPEGIAIDRGLEPYVGQEVLPPLPHHAGRVPVEAQSSAVAFASALPAPNVDEAPVHDFSHATPAVQDLGDARIADEGGPFGGKGKGKGK